MLLNEKPALATNQAKAESAGTKLAWIETRPGLPYFVTDAGEAWTPIGQNDAITWPELAGLFRRRDLASAERYLTWLKASGVTCLRLMMEYAETRHRYIEKPVGHFVPAMVQLWDDLFAMCERLGLRILLTPVDTFWTWINWRWHPWNRANGGPLDTPSRVLLDPAMRDAIKARLEYAARRWGGSGALFAWDLWNEIHPAQAEDSADNFGEFIHDLATFIRKLELDLYGRAHPRTVSLFGPELWWRPQMELKEPLFRHPDLDFATIHIYREGSIDDPANTIAPAVAMGRIVRESLAEIRDMRPFLDSEHGPIHTFKDKGITLPEPFDDEYFRHMQWAHIASGGAGGGMRWPNRKPHILTRGMREAQHALSRFTPLIDWTRFHRRNLNEEVTLSTRALKPFACGDDRQALVWLLRTHARTGKGMMRTDAAPIPARVTVPGLKPGGYRIAEFDTVRGEVTRESEVRHEGGELTLDLVVHTDLALAIRS